MPFKLPISFWIAAFLICWPSMLWAAPIYQAEADGARVVLTDEPCTLAAVSNLKFRATWTEKGKTFEGCWGARPDAGFVMAYWSDRTVVVMPLQIFIQVTGV